VKTLSTVGLQLSSDFWSTCLSIYCSTAIENVGGSFGITNRFCKAAFAGDWQYVDHINEHDKDFPGQIAMLAATGRGTDKQSISISGREIVQHAVAMKFLFSLLVVENRSFHEAIIKYAHHLLMHEDTVQRRLMLSLSRGLKM